MSAAKRGAPPRAQMLNTDIRRALTDAVRIETAQQPFNLSGRGHEPRITLDRRLAQVVRGLELPCLYISGFGANKHYPKRVFARAAKTLRKELGWSPIDVSWQASFAPVPAGKSASGRSPAPSGRENARTVHSRSGRPDDPSVSDS